MARKRIPGGISSIEYRVFVKDPAADAGTLLANWTQVPGVGGVTLPAEEAPSTDEVTLEGVGQAIGFSAAGTVAIPLPRLTQHPAHRMLTAKHESGGTVLAKLVRRAVAVAVYTAAANANTLAGAVEASGRSLITGAGTISFTSVLPGHFVSLAAVAGDDDEILAYDADPTAAQQDHWRSVVSVSEDERTMIVAPGFQAAIPNAAGLKLTARQPGLQYPEVSCKVGTMARGEATGSASVAGNLVLRPDTALGLSDVYLATDDLDAVHA